MTGPSFERSETDSRTFTLRALQLDELPPDRRDMTEREIRGMLRGVQLSAYSLGLQQDVELDVVLAAEVAYEQGHATVSRPPDLLAYVRSQMYEPRYATYATGR